MFHLILEYFTMALKPRILVRYNARAAVRYEKPPTASCASASSVYNLRPLSISHPHVPPLRYIRRLIAILRGFPKLHPNSRKCILSAFRPYKKTYSAPGVTTPMAFLSFHWTILAISRKTFTSLKFLRLSSTFLYGENSLTISEIIFI